MAFRRLILDDVELLYELDNDPEVMRYLNGGLPTPRTAIDAGVLPRMLHASQDAGRGFWLAIAGCTGAFLGWFSLRPVEGEPGTVELGYRLRRSAWGQGYATEGARALVSQAFAEPGVERVVASTFEHNLASRRVLEKTGFRLVRRYRLTLEEVLETATTYLGETPVLFDGEDFDYALDRRDWECGAMP